jgi:hypothetical protein
MTVSLPGEWRRSKEGTQEKRDLFPGHAKKKWTAFPERIDAIEGCAHAIARRAQGSVEGESKPSMRKTAEVTQIAQVTNERYTTASRSER